MNRIKIQVLSDIHLEFLNKFPKITPVAKYLCLAGDIGTLSNKYDTKLKKFLLYCSLNWDKTYYVLGNHEFYQKAEFAFKKTSIEDLKNKYESICSEYNNVHLLLNSSMEIESGLNIYGTTLWTGNCEYPCEPSDILNDYNMISINSTQSNIPLNLNYIDILSKSELDKLNNYLNTSITKNIIMTHFPPIREGSSNPKYSSQPEYIKNYFSWNNIFKQLDMSNVVCWISGHTHWSYNININNTRFVSNQMGYKNELINDQTGFEPSQVFEIEY